MPIIRALQSNRKWLALGLFGLLSLAAGCDEGDKNAKPAAPPTTQAQNEAEQNARRKAFGPTGQPPLKGAPKPADGKPADAKPADAKPADAAADKAAPK